MTPLAGARRRIRFVFLAARAELFDDVLERGDDLVLLDAGLLEAQSQIEGLGWWSEGKDEVLGPTGGRLRRLTADGLPCRVPWPASFSTSAIIFC